MVDNCRMPAYSDLLTSEPSHTFTNIIHILASNSHNNIAGFSKFLLLSNFFANIGQRFLSEKPIVHIDLPIVNTGNSVFSIVFLLKAPASGYSGNIAQRFIFNTIRAKCLNQFFEFCHCMPTFFFVRFFNLESSAYNRLICDSAT